jgi:hypothetical protein
MQKIIKDFVKVRLYLVKITSYLDLQYTKIKLNKIKVQEI